MIEIKIDSEKNIVHLKVLGKIEEGDFDNAISPKINEHLENSKLIEGVLIDARNFDGWSNFEALVEHLNFVKDHHKFIKKLAIVGDHPLFSFVPEFIGSLLDVDVKHFAEAKMNSANEWLEKGALVK